jgi:hypothetical protein
MADATTMTTKGQVTVPREIRDRARLKVRRQDGLHDAQRRHCGDASEDAAPRGPGGSLTRPGQPKVAVEDMNPFKATAATKATKRPAR